MDPSVFQSKHIILRKDYSDTNFNAGKAVLIVFMSIMNVFMFLGNILSIVTICSNVKLRRQVSYWFVLNLAIIDFLISVTVVPLNTMWEYYGLWPLSTNACRFFTFADTSFSTISAYSIVLVSIDKYIYVTHALRYYDRMTHKTALIMIVSVWILVFGFTIYFIVTDMGTEDDFRDHFLELANGTKTCVYVLTDTYVIPTLLISFFLPLAILCFTSSRILCVACRHLRTIHSMEKSSTSVSRADRVPSTVKLRRHTISVGRSPDAILDNSCFSTISTECSNKDKLDTTTKSVTETHDRPITASVTSKPVVLDPELLQRDHTSLPLKEINKSETYSLASFCVFFNFRNRFKNTPQDSRSDTITSSTLSKQSPESSQNVRRTVSTQIILPRTYSKRKGRGKNGKLRPYCKLFGTVTIVIMCFVVMFAPFNVTVMVDVTCHCVAPWVYEDILAVLYYAHSLVNPYIYMATDRKYKAALKLLWSKIRIRLCYEK